MSIPRWKAFMPPDDPERIWLMLANWGSDGDQLVYTTNGGDTWNTPDIMINDNYALDYHSALAGKDNGDIVTVYPEGNSIYFRRVAYPAQSNSDRDPVHTVRTMSGAGGAIIMVQPDNQRIWVFTRLGDSPSENVRYQYSDDNGASWTGGTADPTGWSQVRFGSMPYVDGQPALLVQYLNSDMGFKYYLWNGTAFEARPDAQIYTGNLGNQRVFCHNVIEGKYFHLIFGLDNTLHHYWKEYNNGEGSWNHEVIDQSPYTTGNEWEDACTVRGNELFVFYCKKSNSDISSSQVYYAMWSQATESWGSPELVSNNPLNTTNRFPNTVMTVPATADYIPVFWYSHLGRNNEQVYFNKINVASGGGGTTTHPASIDCPSEALTVSVCGSDTTCVPMAIEDYGSVTVAPFGAWSDGQLCFTADTAGTYRFHVTATSTDTAYSAAECDLTVAVALIAAPDITCAADTAEISSCPGPVCVDLPVANATAVSVPGAAWAANRLCFNADTAGLYTYEVTALNECDTVTCNKAVRVRLNPTAAITCPTDTAAIAICYPETVCVPLPIVNEDAVTVEGAAWADGRLCFDADTSGLYTYSVTAANGCNSTSCDVSVQVTIGPAVDLYLTADDLTLSPANAGAGDTVRITAVIHNTARALEAPAVVVRIVEGDPEDGGVVVAESTADAPAPGGTATLVMNFEVQNTPPEEIYVVIDPDNALDECDEDNNRASVVLNGTPDGRISGVVSLDGRAAPGVPVTLFDDGSSPIGEIYTDASGAYSINKLVDGDYILEIVVPLGTSPMSPAVVPVTISGGEVAVNFTLTSSASGSVTDWWWWQRQLAAIRDGAPLQLGITEADVETYSRRIFDHFYDREDGYAIRIEGCTYAGDPARPLTFEEIAYIFLDADDNTAPGKTRAYLLTCMLNIAAERLSQTAVVSADGATVSQAMTYFANQYLYGNPNDWTLWYYLMFIHTSHVIPAGVIPLGTPNVLFKPSDEAWDNLPTAYSLSQNYPNPFNPTTDIAFTLPSASQARLEVFDVIGRRVAVLLDRAMEAGEHQVRWDASGAASGVYFYRLTASGFSETRKMLLLK